MPSISTCEVMTQCLMQNKQRGRDWNEERGRRLITRFPINLTVETLHRRPFLPRLPELFPRLGEKEYAFGPMPHILLLFLKKNICMTFQNLLRETAH